MQESSKPTFGKVAGFPFVAFANVQPRKGDQRRELSVVDFGFARFALDTDLSNFDHEVWDGTYPDTTAAADQRAVDQAFLQSIVDGSADALTADIAAVEALYERIKGDADLEALFEQAVNVIAGAEGKATATV